LGIQAEASSEECGNEDDHQFFLHSLSGFVFYLFTFLPFYL